MILLSIIFFIPIYYLVVTTFKTPEQALLYPLGLPWDATLDNYARAFRSMNYINVLKNNVLITGISVVGIVLLSAMAGYAISRRASRLNRGVFAVFLIGMMVPYQIALLPLYKLVRTLHLMDTFAAVILLEICYNLPLGIFMFRNFISSIPLELEEASKIDGCGVFGTFFRITLPLLKPVVATVAIIAGLNTWNDFLTPLLFLHKREHGVLLLEVFRNIGEFSTDWTTFFPMMFLAILPLLLFFLFMQKYMIAGITSGAIKG